MSKVLSSIGLNVEGQEVRIEGVEECGIGIIERYAIADNLCNYILSNKYVFDFGGVAITLYNDNPFVINGSIKLNYYGTEFVTYDVNEEVYVAIVKYIGNSGKLEEKRVYVALDEFDMNLYKIRATNDRYYTEVNVRTSNVYGVEETLNLRNYGTRKVSADKIRTEISRG